MRGGAQSLLKRVQWSVGLALMLPGIFGAMTLVGMVPYDFAGSPGPPTLEWPWVQLQDFAVLPDGGAVIGLDPGSRLQQYDAKGRFVRSVGWSNEWSLQCLAVAEDGRLLVVLDDGDGNGRVDVLDGTLERIGTVSAPGLMRSVTWDEGSSRPCVALDDRGAVHVVVTDEPLVRGRPVGAGGAFGPALTTNRIHRVRTFTAADGTRASRGLLPVIRSVRPDGSRVTTHASSWLVLLSWPIFIVALLLGLLLSADSMRTRGGPRAPEPSASAELAWGVVSVVWLAGAFALHALLVSLGWHAAWIELPVQLPWFAAMAWCLAGAPARWRRSPDGGRRR